MGNFRAHYGPFHAQDERTVELLRPKLEQQTPVSDFEYSTKRTYQKGGRVGRFPVELVRVLRYELRGL